MTWTVDVDLALARPPRADRTSRVHLSACCCAQHAELTAIAIAVGVHRAIMAVGSVVVDWPA